VILFLGKVLVSLGAGWVAYALLDNVKMFRADGSSPITSTWLIITVRRRGEEEEEGEGTMKQQP